MQKVWKKVCRKFIKGFDLYREQARSGRDVNDPTPTKPRLQPHSMTILGNQTCTRQDCRMQYGCHLEVLF